MIRFLIMDVDGTLTDGKIYMGINGELFKAFDVKDGYAIKEVLPQMNIIPVIITARNSEIVSNRCRELNIKEVHQDIRNKKEKMIEIMRKYSQRDGVTYCCENVAYIGDDILDLRCMEPVKENGGFIACPSDAVKEVIELADFVSTKRAGNGAVREVIDFLFEKSNGN